MTQTLVHWHLCFLYFTVVLLRCGFILWPQHSTSESKEMSLLEPACCFILDPGLVPAPGLDSDGSWHWCWPGPRNCSLKCPFILLEGETTSNSHGNLRVCRSRSDKSVKDKQQHDAYGNWLRALPPRGL